MSRIFSKLEELPQQRIVDNTQTQTNAAAPIYGKIQFSIFLILCTIAVLFVVIFLGVLSSNVATIKSNVFLSMDTKIQQQQNQLILLTKKLIALQSSVDSRNQRNEETTKSLNKNMQNKIDDMNNNLNNKLDGINDNVNSRLDQANANSNRMEAVLQANIDALNTKINKLQMSLPAAPSTEDQTTAVITN